MNTTSQYRRNLRKLRAYLKAKAAGRQGYEQADKLLEQLIQSAPLDTPLRIERGKYARLVDRFQQRTLVFQPVGVRRYEVMVHEIPEDKMVHEVPKPKKDKAAAA